MADEQDVPARLDLPLGLAVDLGDQRAGRVEIVEARALRRPRAPAWARHGRKTPPGARRALRSARRRTRRPCGAAHRRHSDCARSRGGRRPARHIFERALDDDDGAVDSGAEAARRGDQHMQRRARGGVDAALGGVGSDRVCVGPERCCHERCFRAMRAPWEGGLKRGSAAGSGNSRWPGLRPPITLPFMLHRGGAVTKKPGSRPTGRPLNGPAEIRTVSPCGFPPNPSPLRKRFSLPA